MNKRKKSICTVDGCGKILEGRGLCKNHYERWRRKNGILGGPFATNRTETKELLKERFDKKWELHNASGCWMWNGTRHTPNGAYAYQSGEMVVLNRKVRAHRVAWMVYRGPIDAGQFVLHKCDNPLCVNPDHLYLGSHADNMRDMAVRGRTHWKKVSSELAAEIRASTESTYKIAKRLGLNKKSVQAIRDFSSKKHYDQPPR